MYSITMINKNGYTIKRKFKTIAACKDFANFYPFLGKSLYRINKEYKYHFEEA